MLLNCGVGYVWTFIMPIEVFKEVLMYFRSYFFMFRGSIQLNIKVNG